MSTLSSIKEHRIDVRHNSSDYEDVWYASKYMPVPPPYNTPQIKLQSRSLSLDNAVKNLVRKIKHHANR
jgi:hypothetical protein